MAEYIEREAIMQAFADYVWNSNHSDLVPAPQWNHAVDIVRDYPTADVKPVARGEWIKNEGRVGWHCSCCGVDNNYAYSWNSDTGKDEFQDNFCPSCGADMRGENDG